MKQHIRLQGTDYYLCGLFLHPANSRDNPLCPTCKRVAKGLLMPSLYTPSSRAQIRKLKKR